MSKAKTIFLDIDGTLTDGKVYYTSGGDEIKTFDIKDGLIISSMVKLGYVFIIVTGRKSSIVDKRMKELGVEEVYQGVTDKYIFVDEYLKDKKTDYSACVYIGDDLNDVKIMKKMGITGCPNNACKEIKRCVDIVSDFNGGDGAVRQILEHILKKNNDWAGLMEIYE